jgi:transglutaminase-like putative cysteine protease
MLFEISHLTDYRYGDHASEAYLEARLTPSRRPEQEVLAHELAFSPGAETSSYIDYFGNPTTFYSMTLRHERLTVTNRMTVRTLERALPDEALGITVAEARQILSSALIDVFDYLQPTGAVPTGAAAKDWAQKHLRGDITLREALGGLNRAIHEKFEYRPGTTDLNTSLAVVWKKRSGVCQDFAHIMLSILRTAGLPARYVCGYIESEGPVNEDGGGRRLVGAVATHAWVEVLVPGLEWVALDPTNNQWCGAQHVSVSVGRDFADATPVRGTFKGSGSQEMKVRVTMRRLPEGK